MTGLFATGPGKAKAEYLQAKTWVYSQPVEKTPAELLAIFKSNFGAV